jgi:hypothetical protein
MFSACAEDLNRVNDPQTELRLEAVGQPVITRGVTSTDIQNTLFDEDEQINTYTSFTGAINDPAKTNWDSPMLLKALSEDSNNPGVIPLEAVNGKTLYFPTGENVSATINAVYPSRVNSDVTTFSVASPQVSDDDYKYSDLMFASVTTPKTDQTVHLQFAHQMAKLVVNAEGIDGLTIKEIKLLSIAHDVEFDPSTTPWQIKENTLGVKKPLVMASNGSTYTSTLNGVALFPPQTYSETNFLDVAVKTTDDTEGTAHFLVENKSFEGGKVYTINMKIGPKNLQTGESGTVVIAPWPASVGTINVQAVGNLGLKVESLADDGSETTNTLQGSGSDRYYTYNGKICTPIPTVSDGKEVGATTLSATTDYDVAYYNNLNAGTAIIVVTGKGEYEGLSTFTTFQIKRAANNMAYPSATKECHLSRDAKVDHVLQLPSYQTAEVYGNMTFKLYSDAACTQEYSNADPIATLDVYGNVYMKKKGGPIYVKASMDDTGNFEAASVSYMLTISAGDVSQVISVVWDESGDSFEYNGSVIQPANFSVLDNGNTMAKGTDYTVSYGTGANQTNVCTAAQQKAYVKITGINEYSGDKIVYFNITQATNSWTTLNKPSVALAAPASASSPQLKTSMALSLPAQTFKMAGAARFGSPAYTSSAAGVATVSNTGVITAVAVGTTTITASVTGNSNYTSLSEAVTVKVEAKNRIFVYNGTTESYTYSGNRTTDNAAFTCTNISMQVTGGSAQACSITFTKSAKVTVAVVGAGGGNDGSGRGGVGGCVVAEKSFSAGSQSWYVFCGGGGQSSATGKDADSKASLGGWLGGARPGTAGTSGAGGGVTALCTSSSTEGWTCNTSTDTRMLVAGAGGGSSNGGNGGEPAGKQASEDGNNPGSMISYTGSRAKWMGGRANVAGEIYASTQTHDGGSGGAGFYGGLGGAEQNGENIVAAGGHGGSNYIKSDWTALYNGTAGTEPSNSISYGGFTIPYNGHKLSESGDAIQTLWPGYVLLKYTYDVEATEPGWN